MLFMKIISLCRLILFFWKWISFVGKNCCKKEIFNILSINILRECELIYDLLDLDLFDDEGDEEIMKIIINISDVDV